MAVCGTRSVNVGDVIELSLPSELSLDQASERMPDFAVYYIKQETRNLLGVYIGNAPDVEFNKLTKRQILGGCVLKGIDSGPSGRRSLDAVLALGGSPFPRFVHFFARNLSDMQFALVQELLRTLVLKAHYSCDG
jgi:hypothetical protein